ncbi:MAG: hypothetical protein D3904_02690 [Candidatus Electrothrix sp. EH2]|nr:hypothetical protein [Candidatus Electrothrix sp. EH2]
MTSIRFEPSLILREYGETKKGDRFIFYLSNKDEIFQYPANALELLRRQLIITFGTEINFRVLTMIHFNSTYSKLPERFFKRNKPAHFPDPKLLAFNSELAAELEIAGPAPGMESGAEEKMNMIEKINKALGYSL